MKSIGFALILGALGVACSGVDDGSGPDSPETAMPNGAAATPSAGSGTAATSEERVEQLSGTDRVVIAEVKLSATHTIQFAEFPKQGISEVTERLHADLDGAESSVQGAGAGAGQSARGAQGAEETDEPIDALYARAATQAGQPIDAAVMQRLGDLRARIDAESAHANTVSEVLTRSASLAASTPANVANVESVAQA